MQLERDISSIPCNEAAIVRHCYPINDAQQLLHCQLLGEQLAWLHVLHHKDNAISIRQAAVLQTNPAALHLNQGWHWYNSKASEARASPRMSVRYGNTSGPEAPFERATTGLCPPCQGAAQQLQRRGGGALARPPGSLSTGFVHFYLPCISPLRYQTASVGFGSLESNRPVASIVSVGTLLCGVVLVGVVLRGLIMGQKHTKPSFLKGSLRFFCTPGSLPIASA